MLTLIAFFYPAVQDTARYAELAAAFVVFAAISVSSAGIGLRIAKSPAKDTVSVGKKNYNFLWPEIDDTGSARAAARQAMWAAFCCSGLIALTAFLANNGVTTLIGVGTRMAVLRALLYGMLAIGIQRVSRSAASLALLIFLLERTQESGPIAMTVILLICFANGVRGTFAYHQIKGS